MEELYQLRKYLASGQYDAALLLLDEMEEMSRDDKIIRIASFMEILLAHLIKQAAEQPTAPAWERSVHNALRHIVRTNKRRKAGGYYLRTPSCGPLWQRPSRMRYTTRRSKPGQGNIPRQSSAG